jgi:hypothetical protein
MLMSRNRSYSELRRIDTFEERFDYLELKGIVGESTFGYDRWINQQFYTSREWRRVRTYVISRDNGCDLGVPGFEIHSGLVIHHMNPVSVDDITHGNEDILNPEFLIVTSLTTHNAIHYGGRDRLPRGPVERTAGDTKLW